MAPWRREGQARLAAGSNPSHTKYETIGGWRVKPCDYDHSHESIIRLRLMVLSAYSLYSFRFNCFTIVTQRIQCSVIKVRAYSSSYYFLEILFFSLITSSVVVVLLNLIRVADGSCAKLLGSEDCTNPNFIQTQTSSTTPLFSDLAPPSIRSHTALQQSSNDRPHQSHRFSAT